MRRNGWWSAGVFILVIAILFSGDAWIAHHRQVALLNADADRTPADPYLSAFAQKVATPIFHARCAGCHGDDLHGDRSKGVPDLAAGHWLYGFGEVSEIERTIAYGTRDDIFRSIAHGHAGICPGWNGPPDATAVRALAVYIYLRSHKA